jgi:hypothetical protein
MLNNETLNGLPVPDKTAAEPAAVPFDRLTD